MFADAGAAIVAGGGGRRMGGATKALLRVAGRTILERQLDVLRPLFSQVVVVVAGDALPFAQAGLPIVGDRVAGKGAPGGVHAAIATGAAEWVFCVASDMPLLSGAAIELLAARRDESVDAVAFEREGFAEPLFAFYSKRCALPFEQALVAGSPSLQQLLRTVRTRLVGLEELRAVDPGLRSLENVNTPEDLARIEAMRR